MSKVEAMPHNNLTDIIDMLSNHIEQVSDSIEELNKISLDIMNNGIKNGKKIDSYIKRSNGTE